MLFYKGGAADSSRDGNSETIIFAIAVSGNYTRLDIG